MILSEQTSARDESGNGEAEERPQRRYYVDLETDNAADRSLAVVIARRRCYADQQSEDEKSLMASDPKDHIKRIVEHCADTSDYLLPDTPLKEAVFRMMLASGNQPVTAEEISQKLTAQWALSTNRRDISMGVIQRLLDNSPAYGIVAEPEPEPEPEPSNEDQATEDGAADGEGVEEEAKTDADGT